MILDASALVDALVGTTRAEAVLAHVARAAFVAAPQLLIVEVTSAIARLERAGAIDSPAADNAMGRLADLNIDLVDHRDLLPLAWGFRGSTRIADSFYLAAATALGVPVLTTDRRLANAPRGVPIIALG